MTRIHERDISNQVVLQLLRKLYENNCNLEIAFRNDDTFEINGKINFGDNAHKISSFESISNEIS